MRVILKSCDIDNVYYNNNFQDKPINDTITIYGSVNKERTRYTFKLNMYAMLGTKKMENNNEFSMKLINMICINENGQNIIDYNNHGVLRTCNVVMSGLRFCNGKNEGIIGQFTNYDPNREFTIPKINLANGNSNFYRISFTQANNTAQGFCDFLNIYLERLITDVFSSSPTITRFINYGRFIGNSSNSNNTYFNNSPLLIFNMSWNSSTNTGSFNWYEPNLTLSGNIPIGNLNNHVFDFETRPYTNQWFQGNRLNENRHISSDNEGITELYAYIPKLNNEIEITIELRDLLNNKLIIPSEFGENNKIYPTIQYVFEIN